MAAPAPEEETAAAAAAAAAAETAAGDKGDERKIANKERDGGGGGGKGRKRKKEAFIYGNYRNYYSYRLDRNMEQDPRLEVFKKEWFEGKDCLDIGCNQGLITVNLAKKFQCQSIRGIDIDPVLIETAYWNLRRTVRLENAAKKCMEGSNSSHTKSSSFSKGMTCEMSTGKVSDSKNDVLSKIVSFHCENFVESLNDRCSEKYDTVICLSVTKWIHLNWGDDGLITLFVKIWRLLRPGGILILEPQPWTSYKRNKCASEAAKVNYSAIFLHPKKFPEILLDKVGFRSFDVITDRLSGTVTGFDRPIQVYRK